MKIQLLIKYPNILKELSTDDTPILINFKNQEYFLETKFEDTFTYFILTTNFRGELGELTEKAKKSLINNAIELINQNINRIRTFHHNSIDFRLISPRIVQIIEFSYQIKSKTIKENIEFEIKMPNYLKEFYDYLNEEENLLSLSEKLEIEQLTYLHLIINGFYNFYESNFNECVINCSTAIEAMIFPILQEWLKNKLFHKNTKTAQQILMDISMNNKYELLFGTVERKYLENQTKLLEVLKSANKLRNSIIHSGHQTNKNEAENILNYSAKLIYIIHFKVENLE